MDISFLLMGFVLKGLIVPCGEQRCVAHDSVIPRLWGCKMIMENKGFASFKRISCRWDHSVWCKRKQKNTIFARSLKWRLCKGGKCQSLTRAHYHRVTCIFPWKLSQVNGSWSCSIFISSFYLGLIVQLTPISVAHFLIYEQQY